MTAGSSQPDFRLRLPAVPSPRKHREDAGQHRGKTEPGDCVLQVIVRQVRLELGQTFQRPPSTRSTEGAHDGAQDTLIMRVEVLNECFQRLWRLQLA